jgi:hypothetical protein
MEVKEMKKYFSLVVLLAVALSIGLMVGCQKDNPVQSGGGNEQQVASIELRILNPTIRGVIGEVRTESVTAVARNSRGVAVQGATINFAIQSPQIAKGTIAPTAGQDSVTNSNGEFFGTYTVQLSESTPVVIEAHNSNVTATVTITLEIVNDIIGSISLTVPPVIVVTPNQVKQAGITASVTDREGIGIAGILVHLRTDPPSLGTVDSDTGITDFNGQVSRTFSTIAGRTGTCTVIAQVGDSVAMKDIEIVEASKPVYIDVLADPSIVQVAEGSNTQINISAYVTDNKRVGVPDVTVDFSIGPYTPDKSSFGAISVADSVDRTDDNGRINATFITLGETGKVYAVAKVLPTGGGGEEAIEDSVLLTIKKLANNIGRLDVRASPSSLSISVDTLGKSMIYATLKDTSQQGIPNVKLEFWTDLGWLARPTDTDSAGTATAEYYILPRTDFLDLQDQEETATVIVTLPGTDYTDFTQITTKVPSSAIGTLTMTVDPVEIYADNDSLTYALLTVQLKDADGAGIAGASLKFSATHGAVQASDTTDASGVCYNTFNDLGVPSTDEDGNPVPAIVTVKYEKMDLEVSKEILISARNPISIVNLYAQAVQMTAGSGDSTLVTAACVQENGQRAPDGTEVNFKASLGLFTNDAVRTTGGTGRAETYYHAPGQTGTAILSAYVINADGDTAMSNDVLITVIPGLPVRVSVESDRASLITNDPNEFATITATVQDTLGNAVRPNTNVSFQTDLGTVAPFAVTDSAGHAQVRLTAGVTAGFATVTATVNGLSGPISAQTTVQFIAGDPNSIELTADPLTIQVRETGGHESATLSAKVYDPNGNPVTTNTIVYFELIRQPPEPNGCNINNHGQKDSAYTAQGIATATLNSGTNSGPVLVKAYTWRDPDTRLYLVQVTNSNVQVVSGPPELMDIDVNDDGNDAGGGAWVVEVSARVYDFWRNPVANNIPVAFTVEPDIATINPASTGNVGSAGDSAQGLAYTLMTYNSDNTFDTLTIHGLVENPTGEVNAELLHALPLQDGDLQLNCDPTNWMFVRPPAGEEGDPCLIRVWAVLQDGHQRLVNNGPILFTTNRATFWRRDIRGTYREYVPPEPSKKYTGWRAPKHADYNEEDGIATVYLRGVMDDFFLDIFTLEITVQINASVEGYNDVTADPGFIFMTRH